MLIVAPGFIRSTSAISGFIVGTAKQGRFAAFLGLSLEDWSSSCPSWPPRCPPRSRSQTYGRTTDYGLWHGGLMLLSPGRVSAGSGRQPVPGDDRLGRGGVALARGDCGSMVPELCNCAGLAQVVAAGAGRLTSGGRQPRPTAADGGRLCTRHCDGLWWSHARGRPCT